MPGMRLFGRRCALATDDWVFLGVFDTVLYTPWLGWAPVVYASFLKSRAQCDPGEALSLLDVCLPALCVLFAANWVNAALLVIFSSRGTISQPEPRKHVVTLMYYKLLMTVLDAACAALGTVILTRDSICDILGVIVLIKVSTVFQWLATFVRLFLIVVFYDWNFSKNTKNKVEKEFYVHPIRQGTFKKWNFRMQSAFWWCTTSSDARNQALNTSSELLALLSYDLDLVGSDVIAGFILYNRKCKQRYKLECEELEQAPPILSLDGKKMDSFPPDDFPSWMNLQIARHYFDVGLGVLGWPWYIYRNGALGICHLIKYLKCCLCLRQQSDIVGDNCCACNFAGLRAISQLPYSDIVHANFEGRVFEVPFFVAFDHKTSVVLISVRGTMSMNDVLTDVAAEFDPMDEEGCPEGGVAHGGMLHAARAIKRKLQESEILDEAFKQKPDYGLILTGHSLGGAVASLLTLLLKRSYPNVRCYAFAPPPTMNRNLLPYAYDSIFTIIYGNDCVCLLNYHNVKNMVVELAKCLKECNIPKYKVFMMNDNHKEINDKQERLIENDIKANGNIADKITDSAKTSYRSVDLERGGNLPVCTESVYIGGRILHIRRTRDAYRLKISSTDDYQLWVFRPRMVYNHFPQFMQTSLEALGKNPTLKSESMPPILEVT